MRITHRLVPGLLAGTLLLGGASGALAAKSPAPGKFGFAAGQVGNLSSTGFSLTWTPQKVAVGTTLQSKTIQVSVGATTRERARKGTSGPLASGEYALVFGQKSATGIQARRIIYSSTPFRAGRIAAVVMARHLLAQTARAQHRLVGTVQSTTAASLTVVTAKGKAFTVTLTPTTRFRINGQLQQVTPTIATGQKVVVRYHRDQTTKALVAIVVAIRTS